MSSAIRIKYYCWTCVCICNSIRTANQKLLVLVTRPSSQSEKTILRKIKYFRKTEQWQKSNNNNNNKLWNYMTTIYTAFIIIAGGFLIDAILLRASN